MAYQLSVAGFTFRERLRRFQKIFHFFFFAWLGFQLCPNSDSAHDVLLL